MSHNPHDWSDGIPDCIIFASTADAERGAAMYRSMADAIDAQAERIKALEGALIPDGWKLVPREATIGMCEAAYGGAFDTVKQLDWFKAQWRDYLEAVPEVSNARALLGEK